MGFIHAAPVLLLLAIQVGCIPKTPAPVGDSVVLTTIADGFTAPVGMVEPNDGTGRFFVIDQIGVIHIVDPEAGRLSTPFLDLRSRMITLTAAYDERGLLGLAFHPEYRTNGRLFVFYDAPRGPHSPPGFDADVVISEFAVSADDANAADPDSEQELLRIAHPQFNHQGGQLAFGADGMLFISVGDGGGAGDTGAGHTAEIGNAQDQSTLLGKVLRIDVNRTRPYAIPTDNPFVAEADARGEIWAYGFRNPWRFSFDVGGGHRLFLADVGQGLFEEVDIVRRGGNYGWHIHEGVACFDPANQSSPPADCPDVGAGGEPLIDPILVLPHGDPNGRPQNTSVIGGFVYRGRDAGLAGDYVFGDYTATALGQNGRLYAAREQADGSWALRDLVNTQTADGRLGRYLYGFGQDGRGEIYVLTSRSTGPSGSTGELLRLDPAE